MLKAQLADIAAVSWSEWRKNPKSCSRQMAERRPAENKGDDDDLSSTVDFHYRWNSHSRHAQAPELCRGDLPDRLRVAWAHTLTRKLAFRAIRRPYWKKKP
jgi:hypothetical protein